ncbi:hypothetical protein CKO31_16620 [Thiohalocapsa halophila]|uniref:Tetratricopeptide repeat protein n=1 Tax=Thiohalocapsa halophila TaxID=69359 RepID=A0ABS1CK84_9GAMM|nr:hypothetical protein [Thiohalocapsa halophila]MBK1632331.1 hypothetical protein [Thiohalocapsa halophila]
MSTSRTRWVSNLTLAFFLLGILGAAWLAYTPSLDGPFLLDDGPNLNYLGVERLEWDQLKHPLLSGRFNGFSRSVGRASLLLTKFVSGEHPAPYKRENVLLHMANGLLISWLAALLFRAARSQPASKQLSPAMSASPEAADWWPALLVGSLWLLHPLLVSTVAYVVQRFVILSAFFSLLTAICYLKGRLALATRPALGIGLMLLGFLVLWPLGLLTKENTALLAPTLLAVEWLIFRSAATAALPRRVHSVLIALFLALPCLLACVYIALRHETLFAGYLGRDFAMHDRLLSEIHALWLYIKLIFVPIPGQMALFHDGFPVQRDLDAATMLRALGISSLLLGALALRRRCPLVGLGILWFFIWHAMESTILPLELVFEHRNYLALFGPVLAAVAVVSRLSAHAPRRRLIIVFSAALVLLLTLNTASRAYTWGDIDRLAAHEYSRHPESPRATNLLLTRALSLGRFDAARPLMSALQERAPTVVWPLLVELHVRCNQQEPPLSLLEKVHAKIDAAVVRPADVELLRRLWKEVGVGRCPAVTSNDLLSLVAHLAQNDRVHNKVTIIGALNLYSLLAAESGDFDTARAAMRQSIQHATTTSPGWIQATVTAAAEVASYHSTYDDAVAFIKEVTRGKETRLYAADIVVRLTLKARAAAPRDENPPAVDQG